MVGTYTVNQVANWFLSKDKLSPKKLQKLVYYAYAWYIVSNNHDISKVDNLLFDDQVKAWEHGPVVPSLWHKYKAMRDNKIEKLDQGREVFDERTTEILNKVWDTYGHYPADELEGLTPIEDPWCKARANGQVDGNSSEVIAPKDIYAYYTNQSLDDVPFKILTVQIEQNKEVFEWLKDK